MKSVLIRVTAIALAALLGGFGVAEIGLRLVHPQQTGPSVFTYDPRTGSLPTPNLRGRFSIPGFWSYNVTHDTLGMRTTGIVSRESARTRILLLGGSYAYGYGVNDRETFAYLLEEQLSRTLHTAVMNAGSGGKGTDYALRFFETIGRDLRPDLTILCFVYNDFMYNGKSTIYDVGPQRTLRLRADRGATYRSKEFLSRSRAYNWLISWSHVVNFAKTVAVHYLETRSARDHERPWAVTPQADRKEGWAADERNRLPTKLFLEHLIAAVREAGSDFLVVYAPGANELDLFRSTGQISKDEAALISLLGPNQGMLYSLTALFAGSGQAITTLYYHEDPLKRPDGRWRPAGHALAAGYLEGPVRERLHRRHAATGTGQ